MHIIHFLLQALDLCQYDLRNVVVLSPYRSQVIIVKRFLEETSFAAQCEVSTIDKYQGRDTDVVIVSTVRSNASGSTGELLRDWRRINVAITRYKKIFCFCLLSRLIFNILDRVISSSFSALFLCFNLFRF